MEVLIISEKSTDLELFKNLNIEDFHLSFLHLREQGEIIQHIVDSNNTLILINPVQNNEWNTELLNTLSSRFPLHPVVLFCSSQFEEQALKLLNKVCWDYLLIEGLNANCLKKTLVFNFSRIDHFKALQSASQQVKEAKEYSNRLLARMSHEIRTPMNAVIGMAEMLNDTELNSKQRYYVETIQESGTLLVALFNDLLDFSKIEAGTIRIHDKPFDLQESIRECIASVLENALEKRIELITNIEPTLPQFIRGDDLRVRQILMNLLDNAIKFTPQGFVRLDVRQKTENNCALLNLAVTDTGPGIRSDLLPHLFKPYVQASEHENIHKKGIGLGLAICEHLAKRMKGSIDVQSNLGEGSTFTIKIPLIPAAETQIGKQHESLHQKKVLYLTNNSVIDSSVELYCNQAGLDIEIQEVNQEHPFFNETINTCDLLITHLRTGLKIDLKLIDAVREKRQIPHILIKDREKMNEKLIVIRKDTVIMLKPLDFNEFWEVAEAVLKDQADNLNTIDRHMQLDERMGEYHPLDILVAEDNAINQRIIMSVLNRYGYQVKLVENGKEALESLERRIYDVVLMDIQMPVMDGMEATKRIRERFHPGRQPYVIALTADALQQSRTEYLAQGMDEVLYKPVQTKSLMQMLAACKRLDRSKRNGS